MKTDHKFFDNYKLNCYLLICVTNLFKYLRLDVRVSYCTLQFENRNWECLVREM